MGRFQKRREQQYQHETAMADKTLASNLTLADHQFSKDTEAWNRQNKYNDPAAQYARLKGSGLNPNLAYGQATTGNATQLPKYQSPTADYSGVSNPNISAEQGQARTQQLIQNSMAIMDQYMSTKMKAQQIDLTRESVGTQHFKKQQAGMDFAQTRQLLGYDPSDSSKDRYKNYNVRKPSQGLTDYNQRMVDEKYARIDVQEKAAVKAQLEAQIKSKEISFIEANRIAQYLGIILRAK